jgi:glycosyltransferase involved in cell wall biosynthesis
MENNKKLSIILAVHNQQREIEQNMPIFLDVAQQADAEVIVVDDMSDDGTADVLTQLNVQYADVLYTTFLPHSVVLNPSRKRLALTVGAKAAKTQRIVLADIERPPVSTDWLEGLAEGCAALVFNGKTLSHVIATDLDDFQAIICKAERKSGKGHRGRWMKRRRGLYDALAVNRDQVFEAIQLFDRPIKGWSLAGLRLKTWLGF